MDRVRFIELIESETARLSPEGRDLWEELELIRESILDPADEERMAREYDVMERIFDLPMQEQFVTSRLAELVAALRRYQRGHAQGPGRGSEGGPEHDARPGDRPTGGVGCACSFAAGD